MDIVTLRTFLEVHRTRHFARAAENLCVTQAAVSARIRQLEESVGARLFTRTRNNIRLTPAGHRLLPQVESILETWNRALLEAGAEEERPVVALGCLPSLREVYLDDWIAAIQALPTPPILQVELLNSATLTNRVREQSLSLALVYEPPFASELRSDLITTMHLTMVSSRKGVSGTEPIDDFISVDWGTSLMRSMAGLTPAQSTTLLRVDTPGLALALIRRRGGTAFLPQAMIEKELADGQLHGVADVPGLERSVYLIRNVSMLDHEGMNAVTKAFPGG